MGINSNGILCFGFEVGEEGEDSAFPELFDEEDMEFEDFIYQEAGISKFQEGLTKDQYAAYFKSQRDALSACPVTLVQHCSYDYPMHILAINGTASSAYRGSPKVVDTFEVSEQRIIAAKEWCEKYKIEWKQPKWLLCSIYG